MQELITQLREKKLKATEEILEGFFASEVFLSLGVEQSNIESWIKEYRRYLKDLKATEAIVLQEQAALSNPAQHQTQVEAANLYEEIDQAYAQAESAAAGAIVNRISQFYPNVLTEVNSTLGGREAQEHFRSSRKAVFAALCPTTAK
jgi:hypothetical protein